ncbi:GATA transcription factor [Quillaja saponaria]|uniref:GATA transcription factor n=1 Tax=Quillaja saponaria TaxID=32244 RepID=A0AAD7VJA9_QUISA|nr:GATA transcription factor [Quillaja saponaria]
MMDPMEKESSAEEMGENKKCCTGCKTTKTPLWRGGPAGPKSLCNACGIRYRKRRVPIMGLSKGQERKRDRAHATAVSTSTATTSNTTPAKNVGTGNGGRDLDESLKMKLMALSEEVVLLQWLPQAVKKQRCQRRRKLGEEELAAVSLMALSCGCVFA